MFTITSCTMFAQNSDFSLAKGPIYVFKQLVLRRKTPGPGKKKTVLMTLEIVE